MMKVLKTWFIIIQIIQLANSKFLKCCNTDEILYPVINSTNYFCNISKEVLPLIIEEKTTLTTYSEECIDKTVNGTVITIDENRNFLNELQVRKINKCCPKNMAYNILNKNCEFHINNQMPIIVFSLTNFFTNYDFCSENGVVIDVLTSSNHINVSSDFFDVTNILTGKVVEISVQKSCFDHVKDGRAIIRSCQERDVCREVSCVRKCCGNGRSYGNFDCLPNIKGVYNPEVFLVEGDREKNWNENVGIIYGQTCKPKYIAAYNVSRLFKNGKLQENRTMLSFDRYCIERQYMNAAYLKQFPMVKNGQLTVYVCSLKQKSLLHQFIILLISCILLLVTFGVYLFIPKLRENTHGKIVMCNVLSIFLAYLSLLPVKAKSSTNFKFSTCATLGYAMNFFLVGAFSWLNVMCFDIFWTFRKCKSRDTQNKISKQFKWYCVYAMAVPLILTTLVIIADHVEGVPENLRPSIGHRRCSFDDRKPLPNLLFFRLPVGLQIISNIIFFIVTIYHFFKVKSEIAKRNDSQESKKLLTDKTTLITIIKLFAIMGIPWFTEIFLYSFRYNKIAWNIFDAINAAQGIFIFIVFVMKKRVYKSIRQRFRGDETTRDSSGTTSSSLSQSMKSLSRRSTKRM